jgi:protein involved in polysaccharide export with SLBB domain
MQRLCLVMALALLPLGCATWDAETIPPQDLPPDLRATAPRQVNLLQLATLGAPVEVEQRIQPGDLLEVSVSDLASENAAYPIPVRVLADGTVRLPLVGPVPVGTLTLQEAEQAIFASYTTQGYLRKPQVLVSLRDTRKVHVYVLGAVNKPGQLELKAIESDLLTALVAAGGLTREAGSHLQIYRRIVSHAPTGYAPAAPLTRSRDPAFQTIPPVMPALTVSSPGHSQMHLEDSGETDGSAVRLVLPPLTPCRQAPLASASHGPSGNTDSKNEAPPPSLVRTSAYQSSTEHPGALLPAGPRVLNIDLASSTDKQTVAQGIKLENGDTIVVEQRKPGAIYVIGMVNKPGEITVPPDRSLHVLEAVGMAGGVDRSSLPNKAVVIRARPEDAGLVAVRIDLDRAKRDMSANILLMPGDTVSVEETAMSYLRGLLRGALRIGLGLDVAPALSLY